MSCPLHSQERQPVVEHQDTVDRVSQCMPNDVFFPPARRGRKTLTRVKEERKQTGGTSEKTWCNVRSQRIGSDQTPQAKICRRFNCSCRLQGRPTVSGNPSPSCREHFCLTLAARRVARGKSGRTSSMSGGSRVTLQPAEARRSWGIGLANKLGFLQVCRSLSIFRSLVPRGQRG